MGSDAGPEAAVARASHGPCARFGVARGAHLEPAASETGRPRCLCDLWKRRPAQATGFKNKDLKLPATKGARSGALSSSRKKLHAFGIFGRAQEDALAAKKSETPNFAFLEAPSANCRTSLEVEGYHGARLTRTYHLLEVLKGNIGQCDMADGPYGVMEAETPSGKKA